MEHLTLWFLILALIGSGLWVWLKRRNQSRRLLPEANWVVTFDEQGIAVTAPAGDHREAKWQNLSRIAIRTTDDGPWSEDVFWGLHENGSAEATVVFPGGATGEQALLKELGARLNGVLWERIVNAMGSTSNGYFVVWQSEADYGFNIPDPEVSETQRWVANITEQLLLKLFPKHPRTR